MEDARVKQSWTWLGVILLVVGFLGHYFAARAIGGSYIAYRDHIFGFFVILLVTGLIIAGLGWRFWKGRRATVAEQALVSKPTQ